MVVTLSLITILCIEKASSIDLLVLLCYGLLAKLVLFHVSGRVVDGCAACMC